MHQIGCILFHQLDDVMRTGIAILDSVCLVHKKNKRAECGMRKGCNIVIFSIISVFRIPHSARKKIGINNNNDGKNHNKRRKWQDEEPARLR